MTSAFFRTARPRGVARLASFLLPALLVACGGDEPSGPSRSQGTGARDLVVGSVPLNDLLTGTYQGFTGGQYPQGRNSMPAAHSTAGQLQAAAIQPLNVNGQPSASGKYVLLSIGMSHTTQEFCSASGAQPCEAWTFMGRAAADASVNKTTLVIANGAKGSQTAVTWDSPSNENYDRVKADVLEAKGLSEKQVQILWVKMANASPSVSLPASNADAYQLKRSLGDILRAAKVRYPNLKQAFISSRSYGGYATTPLNPEPYAYESGFAVKWLVEAQIRQKLSGTIDSRAGDLDYDQGIAPWVAWGPYFWANGEVPRSDGLTWVADDFVADGTHPSKFGETKVGTMLLDFFKSSPHTRCWFLAGQTCS
ncbi:hypothetical protein [Corallococcus llansteffanensis]|uniref:SGNH/GDSL hydrolase family protein n=1 Tax=Corallococcus llansteffanensis TaxID=2316731 RepID=A0A3A8PKM5_9BACT|nr:hypothetical protein [Corallococcus llansteffanensis]RKH56923.1 hypothetical protein D7V93_19310 [Corallococcus llansteffanensis]